MISEKDFCRSFSSYWRLATPTCDLFVRKINLELYERFDSPIQSETRPNRRGFINEIAFQFFRLKFKELCDDSKFSPDLQNNRDTVFSQVRKRIAQFDGVSESEIEYPDIKELDDINQQVLMMLRFFSSQITFCRLQIEPRFPGCGIIDNCAGDVLMANVLYEIKAGERQFRSSDIRQLITYAALNSASGSYDIDNVGLFNPRQSISFEMDLDELCYEISGKSKTEVLSDIIYTVSSGEISH